MKAYRESSRRSQALLAAACVVAAAVAHQVSGQALPYPILYVEQVPVTATSDTVVSIGGSHLADTRSAPRGGGLMIRYPDGTTKDLTRAAGFGIDGRAQTGNAAIAVRDPMVHWSGQRALFSMVVGAPVDAADTIKFHWQIYEIEGLGEDDDPVVTRIAGQPEDFNNIQPAYTSDDKIIFVSDHTLSGEPMVYPARNEQGGVSVTGLWSLDPAAGKPGLLDHSPSGSFKPFVDSYGRVVFSRWDHLQRDKEATASNAVDYASEDPDAFATDLWMDIFPESLTDNSTGMGHKFDLFLPWTMNQDGTGLLTMNHLGRHELATAFGRARLDSNLIDFEPEIEPLALEVNVPTRAGSYLHLAENPSAPGNYVATDAVTSAVSAGRLVTFAAPPDMNADSVEVKVANNIGFARDPSYLSDGRLMGSFTEGPLIIGSYGGEERGPLPPEFIPAQSSPFRVRVASGTMDLNRGSYLIAPTQVNRSNFVDGELVDFSGLLWQLQPVEVVPRKVPGSISIELPEPELKMFGEAGVSPSALKRWLEENEMALVVSRNVTTRDKNDRQQPYNLSVPGGVRSFADQGPSYEVTNLQFFQGDYVRGYKERGVLEPSAGRRVAARVLHDDNGKNLSTDIAGSAKIASDGSTAMFLPAGRAVTWQLTDPSGTPVVRERYWLTFQAGEIRSCANCHGNNTSDQLDRPTATNPPAALRTLLIDWNQRHPEAGASVTPYQFWAELNLSPGAPADGDANGDGLSNFESYAYGLDAFLTAATDPVAKPLTPSVVHTGDDHYFTLTFTLNLNATQLRVVVESSTDLRNWKEAAVLENGTASSNDGSVSVATNTTSELAARGLKLVVLQGLTPLASGPDTYFRLRFEEL